MSEVDDILKEDDNSGQPSNKEEGKETVTSQEKKINVNGKDYTPAEFEQLAEDTKNLVKKLDEQGRELGELRKYKTKDIVSDEDLTPQQKTMARKIFREEFGLIDEEELNRRDYVKSAESKLSAMKDKFGIDTEAFVKEMTEKGVKIPVAQYEAFWIGNHPEAFEKWRKEYISKNKPDIPYTEKPNKGGLELPSQPRTSFGKNVVSQALELIGAGKE